jgi:hypothetical protein
MAPLSKELPIRLARKEAPLRDHFTPHSTVCTHDHHLTPHQMSRLTRGRALHCCTLNPTQLLASNLSIPSIDHTKAINQAITMTTEIDTTAMDIDSDLASPIRASSIRSDSSHVSFVDEYDSLPSNGPTKHAHLIDLGEYPELVKDNGLLQLQDAVATTLYNASVDTLKSFLSPTVNTIKVVFGKKDVQLVIWRKGLEVFVSASTQP